MSAVTRLATKIALASVRKAIPVATPEKLLVHYERLQRTFQLTDDVLEKAAIVSVIHEIEEEFQRREVIPPGR